jgi:hypothetical protein
MTRTDLVVAVVVGLAAAACGGAPAPPAATPTSPSVPPPPSPSVVNLAGAWNGSGSDVQGPEILNWTLTQTGATLAGAAELRPANPDDGSCASCHKVKSGTISGTMTGAALTMKIVFPSGGDGVPTPMCTITFELSAGGVSAERIAGTYSGTDSCEGSFTGGSLTMSR